MRLAFEIAGIIISPVVLLLVFELAMEGHIMWIIIGAVVIWVLFALAREPRPYTSDDWKRDHGDEWIDDADAFETGCEQCRQVDELSGVCFPDKCPEDASE